MSTTDSLLQQYQGQYVPVTFNAGYVALSYLVSLVGAASTLELINRRTSRSGLSKHLLLVSAAVTMGGIAIWCMVRKNQNRGEESWGCSTLFSCPPCCLFLSPPARRREEHETKGGES